jgi:hypothetical protein
MEITVRKTADGPTIQSNNHSANKIIVYNGESNTVSDWARKLNISNITLSGRLQRGWTVDRAFSQKIQARKLGVL